MGTIENVGETGLTIRLDFPDASLIDDFESEFRAMLRRFEQDEQAHRLALAVLAERDKDADDTSGYWLSWSISKKPAVQAGDTIEPYVTGGYSDLISFL